MNKTISLLLFLFGEVLLIFSFIYFGQALSPDVLKLNIAVSSLIYGLFFLDLLLPWVDFNNKSQKSIGSLGLRWFSTFAYDIAAIGIMVFCNYQKETALMTQVLFHAIALFLFILGVVFSMSSSSKVDEVYHEEIKNSMGIESVKIAMRTLQRTITLVHIDSAFSQQINQLDESLRFISPSNNAEATVLESNLKDEINNLEHYIKNTSQIDYKIVRDEINKCEIIIKERKQVYSN
jgi:hypothetical protein